MGNRTVWHDAEPAALRRATLRRVAVRGQLQSDVVGRYMGSKRVSRSEDSAGEHEQRPETIAASSGRFSLAPVIQPKTARSLVSLTPRESERFLSAGAASRGPKTRGGAQSLIARRSTTSRSRQGPIPAHRRRTCSQTPKSSPQPDRPRARPPHVNSATGTALPFGRATVGRPPFASASPRSSHRQPCPPSGNRARRSSSCMPASESRTRLLIPNEARRRFAARTTSCRPPIILPTG